MIVVINKKEYTLPNFENISLNKGIEIEEQLELFADSQVDNIRSAVSLLLDCPYDELEKVVDNQVQLIFENHIAFDSTIAINQLPNIILIDNKLYGKIDYDSIDVRQYGDIDTYLEEGQLKYLSKILTILYRPVKLSFRSIYINIRYLFNRGIKLIYSDMKYETVDYVEDDCLKNVEQFERYIYWHLAKSMLFNYLNFKKELLIEYDFIREQEQVEEQEDEVEITKDESIASNWQFYHFIQQVSNNNIVEFDYWLSKPIRHFFKKLSYMLDVNYMENKNNT